MAITRIIYTNSTVKLNNINLVTGFTPTVGGLALATAQNATVTVNIPRENVNAMGVSGVIDRPQLGAADASFEFSLIPFAFDTTVNTDPEIELLTLSAGDLEALILDAKSNTPKKLSSIDAAGVGSIAGALMASFSLESSVGAMPSMTFSFKGVPSATTAALADSAVTAASSIAIRLLEPKDIILSTAMLTTGSCAQSASVAWDMPIENIMCLGADPTLVANVHTFGNPPGSASYTIESLTDQLPTSFVNTGTVDLKAGIYTFQLSNPRIDSKTNSVAVGELFGKFNYVLSGTGDGFHVIATV